MSELYVPSSMVHPAPVDLASFSSGGGQIVYYTSGTPATPDDTGLTSKAIAVDPTGVLPLLVWNAGTQTWN